MGYPDPRGQSTIEILVILLLLTSFVLVAMELATSEVKLFTSSQLSKESR
jgi:hypothetical protein